MCITFKKIQKINLSDEQAYKMVFPALNTLLQREQSYNKLHSYYNKKKYFEAYQYFLDWIIEYVNKEIGTKNYDFEYVFNTIFVNKDIEEKKLSEYLRYLLYITRLYAKELKENASIKYVPNYIESIWLFMADIEKLVINTEYYRKKAISSKYISCKLDVRMQITPYDLKEAANELLYLNESPSIDKLDFRNIQPCAIMIIRQALELLGKNLIGFHSIINNEGQIIKSMTQVSWEFLNKKKLHGTNWEVTLPLQIKTIIKLNKWANSYVHDPWINNTIIRFYGLECLWLLMQPVKTSVKCYNRTYSSTQYGDYRIYHYDKLKADFESFIQKKRPDAKVNWLPINQVCAYIISL